MGRLQKHTWNGYLCPARPGISFPWKYSAPWQNQVHPSPGVWSNIYSASHDYFVLTLIVHVSPLKIIPLVSFSHLLTGIKTKAEQGMVAHICNPNDGRTEAGGLPWVGDLSPLCSKILSRVNNQKTHSDSSMVSWVSQDHRQSFSLSQPFSVGWRADFKTPCKDPERWRLTVLPRI